MSDERSLTPDEERALAFVLDEIIPASEDGRLPAAGELGLGVDVEQTLRRMPGLWTMVLEGLTALEAAAAHRSSSSFTALGAEGRAAVMNEVASGEHSFPPLLVLQTYAAYYQHPRVLEAFGLESRPPHPHGYEMQPNDLSLLDPVRRRASLYRRY